MERTTLECALENCLRAKKIAFGERRYYEDIQLTADLEHHSSPIPLDPIEKFLHLLNHCSEAQEIVSSGYPFAFLRTALRDPFRIDYQLLDHGVCPPYRDRIDQIIRERSFMNEAITLYHKTSGLPASDAPHSFFLSVTPLFTFSVSLSGLVQCIGVEDDPAPLPQYQGSLLSMHNEFHNKRLRPERLAEAIVDFVVDEE